MKKLLSVFRTNEGIVVEQQNELGIKFKNIFDTKEAMLEHLNAYKTSGKLEDYELNIATEFWALVINHINS